MAQELFVWAICDVVLLMSWLLIWYKIISKNCETQWWVKFYSLVIPTFWWSIGYAISTAHLCNFHSLFLFLPFTCLDWFFSIVFRNEHPIVPIIKEHRTLAKLLNCTLGSICSLARLSMRTQRYTLHGHWLQTTTATGRLSMEEPNLQVPFYSIISLLLVNHPQR